MKIAMLIWQNEPLMEGLAKAFEREGHHVTRIVLGPGQLWSKVETVIRQRYDFWVTHCTYCFDFWPDRTFLLDRLLEENQKIYSWYWENPFASGSPEWLRRLIGGQWPKNFHFLVVDHEHEAIFKDLGYQASYLPLGIPDEWLIGDNTVSIPYEQSASMSLSSEPSFRDDLVFIGTPNRQIQFPLLTEGDRTEGFAQLFALEFLNHLKHFPDYGFKASSSDSVLRQLQPVLLAFMSGDYTEPLQFLRARESAEKSMALLLPDDWKLALVQMRGRLEILYSWRQMLSVMTTLIPKGLKCYGGQEWKNFLLPTLSHQGPRLSEDDLKRSFRHAKIQLCFTKWSFRQALHERPLKVLAYGGFPLTDRPSVAIEFFPEGGLESFKNTDDLHAKIDLYLNNPEARRSVSTLGQKVLRERHLISHRAKTLLGRV